VSGQAVQVAVSFGDAAYARTPGVYTGTVNISSAAMGSVVPIPVSLTVRGVDSFAWGAIPLVQMPNVPFAVSLTALDSTGAVVRGFTGTAVLSGTNTTGGGANHPYGYGQLCARSLDRRYRRVDRHFCPAER